MSFTQFLNLLSSNSKNKGCNIRSCELIVFSNKKPKSFIFYQILKNYKGGYLTKISNKSLLRISELLKVVMKSFRIRKKECMNTTDNKSTISFFKESQNVVRINETALIKFIDSSFN